MATAEEVQPAGKDDGAVLYCHRSLHPSWCAAATAGDKESLQHIVRSPDGLPWLAKVLIPLELFHT